MKPKRCSRSCVVALNGLKRIIKELHALDVQGKEENGATINRYSNAEIDHSAEETLYDTEVSKTKGQSLMGHIHSRVHHSTAWLVADSEFSCVKLCLG